MGSTSAQQSFGSFHVKSTMASNTPTVIRGDWLSNSKVKPIPGWLWLLCLGQVAVGCQFQSTVLLWWRAVNDAYHQRLSSHQFPWRRGGSSLGLGVRYILIEMPSKKKSSILIPENLNFWPISSLVSTDPINLSIYDLKFCKIRNNSIWTIHQWLNLLSKSEMAWWTTTGLNTGGFYVEWQISFHSRS
jgi:hypothetical protein